MEEKNWSDEELKLYREKTVTKFNINAKTVTKHYLVLCELLRDKAEPFRVDTPYGTVNFIPKI